MGSSLERSKVRTVIGSSISLGANAQNHDGRDRLRGHDRLLLWPVFGETEVIEITGPLRDETGLDGIPDRVPALTALSLP